MARTAQHLGGVSSWNLVFERLFKAGVWPAVAAYWSRPAMASSEAAQAMFLLAGTCRCRSNWMVLFFKSTAGHRLPLAGLLMATAAPAGCICRLGENEGDKAALDWLRNKIAGCLLDKNGVPVALLRTCEGACGGGYAKQFASRPRAADVRIVAADDVPAAVRAAIAVAALDARCVDPRATLGACVGPRG
jgi:hypothetical protein